MNKNKKVIWILNENDLIILKNINNFNEKKFNIKIIKLNNNFNEILEKIIYFCLENIKNIYLFKEEKIDNEISKKSISSLIFSLINKFSNEEEKTQSIFNFITQIFVRILAQHLLYNGNKRFAVFILYNLFEILGYKLKDLKNKKYLTSEKHSQKCKNFVISLEGKDYSNINLKEIKSIKKWIINLIIF